MPQNASSSGRLAVNVRRHLRRHQAEDLPDEASEFAGNRDDHFVSLFAASQQLFGAFMQPNLCFPRAAFEFGAQAFLART